MKFSARIDRFVKDSPIKAIASVTLDGMFVVKNLRIVDEGKFCNTFLDKVLLNPSGQLPSCSDNVEFYILTVAWRVLYDDLFKCESYKDDEIHFEMFSELERKLKRYIRQQYSKKSPQIISPELIEYIPDLEDKCLGERIAEIEKMQRSTLPEDISEVKNYIFRLSDLGFSKDIIDFLDSMAIGYTFYSGKSLKCKTVI